MRIREGKLAGRAVCVCSHSFLEGTHCDVYMAQLAGRAVCVCTSCKIHIWYMYGASHREEVGGDG